MSDGMNQSRREAHALDSASDAIGELEVALDEVFDPAFVRLPASIVEELQRTMARYGLDLRAPL